MYLITVPRDNVNPSLSKITSKEVVFELFFDLGKYWNRDPLFTLELGDEEMVKFQGLCWNPVLDEFRSYQLQHNQN